MTKPRLHTGACVEDPRGRIRLPTRILTTMTGPGHGLLVYNERPEPSLRIFRSRPDDNFTIVPNVALRDSRLSYLARGILAELLTHADGWDTNADALWQAAQRSRPGRAEGRRAFRAAFSELEDRGYLVRRTVRGERGRFITVLELHDTPGHQETSASSQEWSPEHDDRGTDYATSVGATSVDATSVSGTSLRSINERSTKEEVLTEEDSAALAGARAADAAASARDQESQLHQLYDKVDKLTEASLRNRLLAFERKRPRIYRECRQAAIDQIQEKNPDHLKSAEAGLLIDRLSFKYALKHYAPDWPAWLLRSPTKK